MRSRTMFKRMILGSIAVITALSFSVSAENFRIATGGEGGGYERQGKIVAHNVKSQGKKYKVDFVTEVINTSGTIENIEMFNDSLVEAIVVQADGLNVMPLSRPFKSKVSLTESVLWIHNKAHGYADIEDIEGKKDVLMVLVENSGSIVTMRSFKNEDSGYEVNYDSAILVDELYDAVDIVADGTYNGKKVAGVLYVSSSIPAEIVSDFSSKVAVGEATDADFNDAQDVEGNPLYSNCKVKSSQLNGMSTSNSWSDVSTVCVRSMIVYKIDFDHKKAHRAVKKAVNKAVRNVT